MSDLLSSLSGAVGLCNVDYGKVHLSLGALTACGRVVADMDWEHEGGIEQIECKRCLRVALPPTQQETDHA